MLQIGVDSHAEGYATRAADFAHSEGYSTNAMESYSHAQNLGTIARYCQTAIGKYNINDTNAIYALILGNGTANNARSNAYTVDWDGNAWFAGEIKVGGANYNSGSVFVEKQINKVTSIDAYSTHNQYPSAKCMYDMIGDIETLLQGV